jgi:hypothetical protein
MGFVLRLYSSLIKMMTNDSSIAIACLSDLSLPK